jgi:vacuolar protein sorting-associated protein 13A/C
MRKSQVMPAILNRVRRDLIHQPLQLLIGVNVLGMTSSTLGTLSRGAAELSGDGKFLRLRSKQERSRIIGGVSDGLLQGTEALARGFAYGFRGVVTKPVYSARQNGVAGFFSGLGKAAVGVVVQPVSGALDFVALTVNGVGTSCTNCFDIFEHKPKFGPARLPRAICGDGILRPYDEQTAYGQAILRLAQSGAYFGSKDVFKEPAKFAWSDFYQDHFPLPKNKILMLTNRRIMMLVVSTPLHFICFF